MKTIVFQSFRTHDVPRWIQRCLASVRSWTRKSGFAYRCLDDGFLALAPDWYRDKARTHITVVTDLARLLQARQCLLNGFDRAIWVDADVLIFSPSLLTIDLNIACGYCREVFISKNSAGVIIPEIRVNNAVCVFAREGFMELEQYINDCYSIVQNVPEIRNGLEVGTSFLTQTHNSQAVIMNVGLLSPAIMEAVLENNEKLLVQYIVWHGNPVYAANLCNSFRNIAGDTPGLFDYLCGAVVGKLIKNHGGVLAKQPSPALFENDRVVA